MGFRIGAFTIDLTQMSEWELSNLKTEIENEERKRKGPVELDTTEKCLVRCGQHIQAIKAYRNRIPGTGLREAKDACDAFRNTIPDYKNGKTLWSEPDGCWVFPNKVNSW